ncbi:MAG: hypothetical protein KC493_14815 [Bacteriovoracaceae bacterium]|nr:hypothetical protein [Bacteriovoracaceae bacterium]
MRHNLKILVLLISTLSATQAYSLIIDSNIMSAVDDAFREMDRMNADGVIQRTCPPERSFSHTSNTTNVLNSCRGDNDSIGNSPISVNNPNDFILSSNVFNARNIKNSTSDAYCRHIKNKGKWSEIGNSNKASIQDLINYQCSQNAYSCSDNVENQLREDYKAAREGISSRYKNFVSEEDKFFDEELNNAKFKDATGTVKTIPKSLLLAILKEESQGKIFNTDPYDYGMGLFNIRRAKRLVREDENGVVIGIYGRGQDYQTNSRYPDLLSLYNPSNNLLKFTQLFQSKYIKFQQTFNGANGSLDFNSLSEDEKNKFILAALQSGEANVITSYKRLQMFNKAMNCNSCETMKKNSSSCSNIALSCRNSPSNKCGKVLPEKFDVMIRFSNFTGMGSNQVFANNMSCLRGQHFGNDTNGPCNLALTKAKTYRIIAGSKCMN